MLCSPPTAKSGSTWLDRLRSSKGIPTGDGLDLDSFLLTTTSHSLQIRPPKPTRTRPPETRHDPPTMTAVLAELFNMGAALTHTQSFKKKCPRKQTNPKFFLASSSSSATRAAAVIAAAHAAPTAPAADLSEIAEVEEEEPLEEENEKEGNELKGFSRSEVTVIDTSLPGWKVDRLVFRKNSVWKVRERKQKSKLFAKKKKSKGTLMAPGTVNNGIGTSKDNAVNMKGEKPVKTHKEVASSQKEVSRKINKNGSVVIVKSVPS